MHPIDVTRCDARARATGRPTGTMLHAQIEVAPSQHRSDRQHRARASRALGGGARYNAPQDARGRAVTTGLPTDLIRIPNATRSAGSEI